MSQLAIRPLGRVPALDGLRGIAILLVLGWHADALLPGGALGVNLFFVLSGFLITSLLIEEHHLTSRVSLLGFYRRRALRLLPGLAFATAVGLAVILVVAPSEFARGLSSLPFIASFTVNMPFANVSGEFAPLWSLSQEEQFYLLWPPILMGLFFARVSPRVVAAVLVSLAAAATAWRTGLMFSGASAERLWYRPDANAESILLGCAMAVCVSYRLIRVPRFANPVLLVSAAVIVVCTLWGTPAFFLALPVFAIAATVTIERLATDPGWWFSRVLSVAPLRALGRISYGLYILHLPLFLALGWRVGLPVSILLTGLSYRYIEQPFLRRKRPHPPPDRRPAIKSAEALAPAR